MPVIDTIKLRRGTAAAWTSANPTLAAGETGLETDTLGIKIGDGSTAWNSLAYRVPAAITGTGDAVRATSPTLVTPLLGTPTSGTLTNCTGLPVSTGISGLGTGVATFLATPSSANLASAVTGETGSGSLVFNASPTFTGTVTTEAITASGTVLLNNVDSSQGIGANGLRIITATAAKGAGVQMGNADTGATNVWQFFTKGSSGDFIIGRANVFDAVTIALATGESTWGRTMHLSNIDSGQGIGANGMRIITATAAKGAGVQMGNATTGSTNVWQMFVKGSAATFHFGRANLFDSFTLDGTTGFMGLGVAAPTAVLHLKAGSATANTAPLKFNTGTLNTTAEAGAMEYNNNFTLTESDATRRYVVQAAASTITTAGAPYVNSGYITVRVNGTDIKIMTTAG